MSAAEGAVKPPTVVDSHRAELLERARSSTMSFSGPRLAAPQSLAELEVRAAALAGRSVGELARGLGVPLPPDAKRAKGFVGELVERALGADPRAGDGPDFPDLGVELKTVPVDGRGVPAESTFCCSIYMQSADRERWETSRLRRRLQHVLWLPVASARQVELGARSFGAARLWRPSGGEEKVLRADWELLMGRIGVGDSELLSGLDGEVLQVRPKAAHAGVRTLAPGDDGPKRVLPLGFYLRARFTAALIAGVGEEEPGGG